MKLHVISPFNTKNTQNYSFCAFTGKALRFPKMMQRYGYYIIEYSNEGSESNADEHIVMLSSQEHEYFYGKEEQRHDKYKESWYEENCHIGSQAHSLFNEKLIVELKSRINPGDIICHTFGFAHEKIIDLFPDNFHVETGIGYYPPMKKSFKIFESYSCMHFNLGLENKDGTNYQWVVPNYYDLNDWIPNYTSGHYLSFLGRINEGKGFDTIFAIAEHSKYPIFICGSGEYSRWIHPNIHYLGEIVGKKRSNFLRNSRAILATSRYIEPFCGMVVEAMLCGTPAITVDYGAMSETVEDGMGFRCHTLKDWIDAIENVDLLDRKFISDRARSKYSLETCGKKYDKIFKQLNDLQFKRGWYQI